MPHAIRRDVLSADEHRRLVEAVLANEAAFVPSLLGARPDADPGVRNSLTLPAAATPPGGRRALTARIEALLPGLVSELRIGRFAVSGMEIGIVAYNHGAFYRRHIDTFLGTPTTDKADGPSDRVLSIVYYFHAEPRGFAGGALRLHPVLGSAGAAHVDIEPVQNGLVAFASWAPHEVLPVECPSGRFRDSRFAANCWVRRVRTGG